MYMQIKSGSGNDVMLMKKSSCLEQYCGGSEIDFGDGNNIMRLEQDAFFSVNHYSIGEGGVIKFGSGTDLMEIAGDAEMRFCDISGELHFGDGVDTLILNGTLALNNAEITGLENVIGAGQLLLGGDKEYNESDFQKFVDAGIDVINIGSVSPFSSRRQELADNAMNKAVNFEKDGDSIKANIWVASEEYAGSVAFGFADEVDYVKFTKSRNTDMIKVEHWGSSGDGLSIEIYDSKSKSWQSFDSENILYGGGIDLSGIQNGAVCTLKVSVEGENYFGGRFYLAESW